MSELIFVTGASGFLASHIIYQLSQQGYRVRGTARSKKAAALREVYKSVPSIEIVDVEDIAHDQFEEALKGVDAVIHTASPLPGRESIDVMLKTAVDGSLNVLNQAEKAGIKKFVVTSSVAATANDPTMKGVSIRDHHWNPVTKDTLPPGNTSAPYALSKKTAELAVWEWAEARPHVSVTTINPPFLYGPLPPLGLLPAPGDFNALSTSVMIYNLLSPTGDFPPRAGYADVRDIANAHIRALNTAFSPNVQGRRRVVISSPDGFVCKDVLELIRRERPELSDRLTKVAAPELSYDRYDIDFARIEEVTGLKKEDFHTTKQAVLDTVDFILKLEAEWKKNGYAVTTIPAMGF